MKNNLKIENIHRAIENSIINMVLHYPTTFYGEFCFFLTFHETNDIPTCGVNINNKGILNLYYNPTWFDSKNEYEINFIIIHEISHLLLEHSKRSVGYDLKLANVAQDMIINQFIFENLIVEEKIDYFLEIPKDEDGRNSALFVPVEYKGELIFEDLYHWLKKDYEKWSKKPKKELDLNKEYGDKFAKPHIQENYKGFSKKYQKTTVDSYSLDVLYQNLDKTKGQTIDIHIEDEVSPDVKKQMIDKIIESCKNRGLISGNIDKIMNKLRKKEKDYLKEIKRSIIKDLFGTHKEKTILRANRRNIEGLKGKYKLKHKINCILDTSGSMCNEFEKALSFIFNNNLELNLIQIDTEIQKILLIKKKTQLEKMTIKGLGGTVLQPALNLIKKDKKLNKYNTLILTDGYTDGLDLSNIIGNVLIITSGKECPIIKTNNKLKQIIINEKL